MAPRSWEPFQDQTGTCRIRMWPRRPVANFAPEKHRTPSSRVAPNGDVHDVVVCPSDEPVCDVDDASSVLDGGTCERLARRQPGVYVQREALVSALIALWRLTQWHNCQSWVPRAYSPATRVRNLPLMRAR